MKLVKADYERLLDQLEIAVLVLAGDLKGQPDVVYSNAAFSHWVAASAEELANASLAFLFSVKDCEEITKAVALVCETGADQAISLNFTGHDKNRRLIDFVIKPFKTRRKKIVACLLQELQRKPTLDLADPQDNLRWHAEQKDCESDVFNRRYFYEQVERECLRLYRYGSVYTLIGVELLIDEAVKAKVSDWDTKFLSAAKILKDAFRSQDIICRNQPDQFMVMMPETKLSQALYVAERLKRAFSDDYAKGNGVRVAIGVTEGKVTDQHFSDTLQRVEASLENASASLGRKVAYSL